MMLEYESNSSDLTKCKTYKVVTFNSIFNTYISLLQEVVFSKNSLTPIFRTATSIFEYRNIPTDSMNSNICTTAMFNIGFNVYIT